MGFMDWALNKSLRKESDKLKSKLDSYQSEYERRMKECQAEIDKAQLEKDADLERIKKSLEQELQQDQEMYEALLNDLVDYAATFLQRKFLYALKENKKAQANILDEDIKFSKAQMEEIGVEIDHLWKRKTALSAFTNVKDIIILTNDCGCDIPFSSDDDADSLLKKVNEAIDNCSDDRIMRISLFRLRGIVYERSEYLSTIKYIEWVIQQKVDYSRQLNDKRQSLITQFKSINAEVQKIRNEIKSLNQEIEAKAEQIRFYWMKPITHLNAEIDYSKKEIKTIVKERESKIQKRRKNGKELKHLASIHSSDQNKWDSLSNENDCLTIDINSMESTIQKYGDNKTISENERDYWYKRRKNIKQLFRNYHIAWKSNKALLSEDEQKIISSRLAELEQVKIEGAIEADKISQQKKEKLTKEYEARRVEHIKKADKLSEILDETEENIKNQEKQLSNTRKKIQMILENDNRFFIVKLVFDPPELKAAKINEIAQKAALSQLQKERESLTKQISDLNSDISNLEKNHTNDLKWCRPKPLRPTSDEKHEEELLKLRQKNIKEKKNDNKN